MITPVFDDPNLIGSAGLVPVLRLAQRAGLHEHLRQGLMAELIHSLVCGVSAS